MRRNCQFPDRNRKSRAIREGGWEHHEKTRNVNVLLCIDTSKSGWSTMTTARAPLTILQHSIVTMHRRDLAPIDPASYESLRYLRSSRQRGNFVETYRYAKICKEIISNFTFAMVVRCWFKWLAPARNGTNVCSDFRPKRASSLLGKRANTLRYNLSSRTRVSLPLLILTSDE